MDLDTPKLNSEVTDNIHGFPCYLLLIQRDVKLVF